MNVALRHLLWKDTRMIMPLVAVVLSATVLLNVLMWITIWVYGPPVTINSNLFLWILLPNLMAVGAPTMLIGSEEESGTLQWLRSLPIQWTTVVASKTLVAIVAVLVSWVFSSLLAWATVEKWFAHWPSPYEFLLARDQVLALARITFQLLFAGFFLAYLCRSPILGLILLVPVFIAMQQLVLLWDSSESIDDPTGIIWPCRMLIAAAYVIFLALIHLVPAKWRLATRDSVKELSPPPAVATPRSRSYPPRVLLSEASRPGIWGAMLWQAWRQQSKPLIGLTLIAGLGIACVWIQFSYFGLARNWLLFELAVGFSPVFLVLVCIWMGCLCFYPDSVSGRHFFFADRAIPQRYVWWSRVMAPAIGAALVTIALAALSVKIDRGRSFVVPLSCCVLGFACGVLASMWVRRGTLAFFISPLLLPLILVADMSILKYFPNYYGYVVIGAVPLLLASWRLTDDWLNDARSWMTQLRAAAHVLLAVVFVPTTIVVIVVLSFVVEVWAERLGVMQ